MENKGKYLRREQHIFGKENFLSEVRKFYAKEKCRGSFPTRKILQHKIKVVFRQKACNTASFSGVLPIPSVVRKWYF